MSRSPLLAVGSVLSAFTRAARRSEPVRTRALHAVAHHGLAGDVHASVHSPRQLLLASALTYARFQLPDAALRENLLVDFSTEELQSGDLLYVGSEVILWMTFQCEPCKLLEHRCPGIAKAIGMQRGMLARVLRGGTLQEGDAVFRRVACIPAMSNDWQDRVRAVVQWVPEGRWISYARLAQLAGVGTTYCRAFPAVLARLPPLVASRARAHGAAASTAQWDGGALFDVGISERDSLERNERSIDA